MEAGRKPSPTRGCPQASSKRRRRRRSLPPLGGL